MTQSRWTLTALICCFITPILLAYWHYTEVISGKMFLPKKAHGVLMKPGTQVDLQFPAWTLVAVVPEACTGRCQLWLNELPYFPAVLYKYDLFIHHIPSDDWAALDQNKPSIESQLKWNPSQDGGVFFIDKAGFVAVAYSFDANPKKVFLDVKKLLVAY
jgi:hypothetical protein